MVSLSVLWQRAYIVQKRVNRQSCRSRRCVRWTQGIIR